MRTTSSREVYRNDWIRVREDTVELADGSPGLYGVVEKPHFALVLPFEWGGFWVVEEFRTRYFDFPAKHFHEAIQGRPMADGKPFVRSYTWTKSVLQLRGLVSKAPRRSAHRKKRARRPLPGMLLFQDGSHHAWLPQGPPLDLVVTLDDATSAILSAVLVEEEGTASSFVGLKEVIAGHGLFSALYTDRGSHYFHTPKAGEPVDKTRLTQVGRALKQLGIEHIPSYCPEGRGRMERRSRRQRAHRPASGGDDVVADPGRPDQTPVGARGQAPARSARLRWTRGCPCPRGPPACRPRRGW